LRLGELPLAELRAVPRKHRLADFQRQPGEPYQSDLGHSRLRRNQSSFSLPSSGPAPTVAVSRMSTEPGYFSTGDGTRCDPFTITDAHSRYLIRCQIVSRMDLSQVRAVCEAAMREYGMPARIRTDNGAPFAGTGLLGLSKLSLGWMKIGIVHERIQPGRPQQNGRHERMHRTLKEDTTNPVALTLRLQQRKFDRFRQMFNHERPHEGLNNLTPGRLYQPSSVMLPRALIEFVYPKGFLTRRVNNSGDISWHKDRVFISKVFRFEDLGFELVAEDFYKVFSRDIEIGEFDVEALRFRPVQILGRA
jgi:transposase InsO family protein